MKPTRKAGAIDFENEPDMDHAALLAHGIDRGRTLAAPGEVGVAIVFEDRHAIVARQLQHLGAAALGQDRAGRVLHRRDGVDIFRRDAAPLVVGERGSQRIDPDAVLVEGNADGIDAEPCEPVQRALIGLLLDQHGVALRQQRVVDEVERLQRAGDDQDVIGRAVDAGIALELMDQEFAQGPIPLRAVGEVIGRERLALAPQHRVDRLDQPVDRNPVRIVVAADKAVLGKPGPLGGRCRQAGGQQRREIELG